MNLDTGVRYHIPGDLLMRRWYVSLSLGVPSFPLRQELDQWHCTLRGGATITGAVCSLDDHGCSGAAGASPASLTGRAPFSDKSRYSKKTRSDSRRSAADWGRSGACSSPSSDNQIQVRPLSPWAPHSHTATSCCGHRCNVHGSAGNCSGQLPNSSSSGQR